MYESHFRLHRRPFSPAVDINSYVGIGPLEESRQTLVRAVSRSSGPAVVIGGAGTGKSMLCQVVAEQFSQQLRVAVLANGRLGSPRALYQAILFELGLPYREMDENELRLSLVDFLSDKERCPNGMLLIIDEAHVVPLRLLEEVRMLTNLTQAGHSQVQLVMAGGPTLEERFTSPKLESFNQRIAARCYLESLNREQTCAFIHEQLAMAGAPNQGVFTEEAIAAVYDATDGIPRLVNQLCDHAMVMAALGRHRAIDGAIVQEAWSDLQQLPTPWVEPTPSAGPISGQADMVEFGTLSDPDGTPASIPFPRYQEPTAAQEDANAARQPDAQELAPDKQLDEIQRQVASVEAGELADAMETVEVPVEPHQPVDAEVASNPFDETFDEEEIVVDGYATLQESFFASAPRVKSEEGQQIAALLAQAAAATDASRTSEKTIDNAVEEGLVEVQQAPAVQPPVYVDYSEGQRRQRELTAEVAAILPQEATTDDESEYDDAAVEGPASIQMRLTGQDEGSRFDPQADDRDLIIVQDEQSDEVPACPPSEMPAARRQKYRQLFARLRQA